MTSMNSIKKIIIAALLSFTVSLSTAVAQNDTMYIMKQGAILGKYKVSEIDSIIMYKPNTSTSTTPIDIIFINIPAGTFTMGSPASEINRETIEVEHQVTLSAFSMSKHEITNAQYAAFLNTKNIGSDGSYSGAASPAEKLIYESDVYLDMGLHYNFSTNDWEPVTGCENNPVVNVTWLGATEFATYVGGTLPTEAQWEYACRGGSTTPFNTGDCLSNTQSIYNWNSPYSTCTNSTSTIPRKTQAVGSYAANAYGLCDMHGNVMEWCSDWYGAYPETPQTNPTGPTGGYRVVRGGGYASTGQNCRSAYRFAMYPTNNYSELGFRVVRIP